MKGWIWVPVALLIGLVAGAVGPRAELRKAREDIAQLRRRVTTTDEEKGRIGDVLRMLQVPKASGDASPARRAVLSAPAVPVSAAAGSNAAPGAGASTVTTTGEWHVDFQVGGPRHRRAGRSANGAAEGGTSLSNRIQQAVELWRMRSDIARSTFIADVGLNEAQAQDFDVLVGAMNLRLSERIGHWADELARTNSAPLALDTGMRMMHDLTGTLVLTYDEMDRKLPSGWREKAGEGANLLDFIAPAVATPLIGVEQKLQNRPRRRTALDNMDEGSEGVE